MVEEAPAPEFSVVIPCYNEEGAIEETVDELRRTIPDTRPYEIVVVNDGSTDRTQEILDKIVARDDGLRCVIHEGNRGYGAALKSGIRQARADLIVITDADGTYPNARIPDLVDACTDYDMVVGSRTGSDVTYSKIRAIAKIFLKAWASWIAGQNIPDINSGMRVFRKAVAESYFGILPNSFSFTTTITLAMLTNYRPVLYVPIDYHARVGQSKIKPIRDTLRFTMLILRTGTYFAPIRAFAPFIGLMMLLSAASLGYDIGIDQNLTDKTVILLLFTFNTAIFALLADMIDKRTSR